jgi:hypothetical protein
MKTIYSQGRLPRGPSQILMKLFKIKDNVINNNKKIKIAADILGNRVLGLKPFVPGIPKP